MHIIAFYKCGGSNPWYSWDTGMSNISRGAYDDEPGFRFICTFEGEDAERQAIAYARKMGYPLHPGIPIERFE